MTHHGPYGHLSFDAVTCHRTGLMMSGFASAARALDKDEYTKRAVEAARFVRSTLYSAEKGILLRSAYRDERG